MHTRSIPALCGAAALAAALAGCGASHPAARSTSPTATTSNAAQTTSVVDGWGSYAGNRRPDGGAPTGRGGGGAARHGGGRHAAGGGGDGARGHHRRHRHAGTGDSGAGDRSARFTPQQIAGIPGTVTQIATSNSDSYALTSTGAVYAIGSGLAGELGDGQTPRLSLRAVRVHFPAGVRIAKLSNPMPYDGGMVIDTKGNVWGWGNDANQELCQPQGKNLDTPVKVPLSHVSLAVGAQRHAVYDAGGRIVSCGLGAFGQLGNGSSGQSSQTGTPVAVRGLPAGRVTDLTSGYGNAGALMADGAYYDWGLNNHGQVGDGTRTMATTAVHVALPAAVREVSEGGSVTANGQAMAILSDGQLWEWGAGADGQMGDGSTSDQLRPTQLREPSGVQFVAVNSGGATDYAIAHGGRLWAWGSNHGGQVADGTHTAKVTRPVATSLYVTQVSSTAGNVEALLARRR